MREMGEDIAVIQTSHGYFRNDHLKESRERGEDSEFIRSKSKASSSGEVSSLHDTRWNEYFGMLLVNDLETSRPFKVS